MNWLTTNGHSPSYEDRQQGAVAEHEEQLRQRIRQLNHQIDDMSRTLRIPHSELLVCVNRLLAAARGKTR